MSLSIIMLVLDGLVLAALAGTIYYSSSLSKSLSVLRGGKQEFANRINELTSAISDANKTISDLKSAGVVIKSDLKDRVDKASYLNDELSQVCQAAEALAGRLETLSSSGRKAVAPDTTVNKPKKRGVVSEINTREKPSSMFNIRDPEFEGAEIYSKSERDLIAALKEAKGSIAKDSRIH